MMQLKPGRWHHLMAVFDGQRQGADAVALYVDGLKAEVEVDNNNLGSNIVANVPLRLGARTGKDGAANVLSGGKVFLQDVRFYDKALAPEDVARLALAGLARGPAMAKAAGLKDVYLAGYDRPSQKLAAELAKLETEEEPIRQARRARLWSWRKKRTPSRAPTSSCAAITPPRATRFPPRRPAALPPMAPDAPATALAWRAGSCPARTRWSRA